MEFDPEEKLALVQMIDSVIQADGIVHQGELTALGKLMEVFDFNGYLIEQAKDMDTDQALLVLSRMPYEKKKALAGTLEEMALADGFIHEKEMALIFDVFSTIGIGRELD
tara:strand:- start:732 stop:1061 length:330 start_codon:yes stop_codon:yes gene_type:complete